MANESENPQENFEKQESTGLKPKTIITSLTLIVSTIISAVLGFCSAWIIANAQVTSAYVPIYATQTAEAKAALSQTPATSLQISVPISNIRVEGKNIGNSSNKGNSLIGEFELISDQAENTFTIIKNPLIYTWESPGILPELNRLPMRGIQSTLTISPLNASDGKELVFCHYTLLYDSYQYASIEQFIPYNQPTALLWDFTGRIDPAWFMKTDENKTYIKKTEDIIRQEGIGFTYYFKKLRELWQWQYLVGKNYEPTSIEKLYVICNVSATKEYRGGKTGDSFIFKGKFTFGDVIIYPNEKTK